MSHVRELQTPRQMSFGASSALKQPDVIRNNNELYKKKSTAIRCILAFLTPGHYDRSIAVIRKGFLPPRHGGSLLPQLVSTHSMNTHL